MLARHLLRLPPPQPQPRLHHPAEAHPASRAALRCNYAPVFVYTVLEVAWGVAPIPKLVRIATYTLLGAIPSTNSILVICLQSHVRETLFGRFNSLDPSIQLADYPKFPTPYGSIRADLL